MNNKRYTNCCLKLLSNGCRLHAKEEPINEVFLASLQRMFNLITQ